jgi:hypothetical protein
VLFRDFGDPMASFTAKLQASTASLVGSASSTLHTSVSACLCISVQGAISHSVLQGLDEAVARIFKAIDIDMSGSFAHIASHA